MQHSTFDTTVHAKCILAGEHAVMRNCAAVVTPIPQKTFSLHYEELNQPLQVISKTKYEEVFLLSFWHIMQSALKLLDKNTHDLQGKLLIKNNIPMGAGLGFSSALCVAIARLFVWKHWLKEKNIFDYARTLEDNFHGKSSGVDIAGAINNEIIHFEKAGPLSKKIILNWRPKLYISYSGSIKSTLEAINQVKSLKQKNQATAKAIDDKMKQSVAMIEQSFSLDQKRGLSMLISAIELANNCFEQWQLISPQLQKHITKLRNLGAIAVKPTGAGIGGYVLSLWDKTPPKQNIKLIPLFAN